VHPDSTILAVSSPPGPSRRGIIRVSGPAAFDLVAPRLQLLHAGRRGAWCDRLRLDRVAVPVIAMAFPGPRSYTGEHVVELQMAGQPDLLARAVAELAIAGRADGIDARPAEAGEFTARAFFNGRLTLVEAEGVAATIAARSDAELAAAAWLRGGELGRFAGDLADELAGALALVEAGIDFTDEEDVVAIGPAALTQRLAAAERRLDERLRHAVGTEALEAIPRVVLTGPPNAGKSTLFNALLGRERAVVSAVAGTTRDVLAEPLPIDTPHGPAEVMLVDVAGVETSDDELDRRMQDAAAEARRRADLEIRCVPPPAAGATAAGVERPRDGEPIPVLVVHTKADLPRCDELESPDAMAVSARTGSGLAALRSGIASRLADRAVSLAADAVALRPRHASALRTARDALASAAALVAADCGERALRHPELVAAGLRHALDSLASLAGAITPDDVLGRIFAGFCIGK
jgi:tRNA modification GTPase